MESLAQRFHLAIHTIKRNIESDLPLKNDSQITRPQLFMLYYINKFGNCKLSQLADKLEVKPSAISVMIDRLEKAELVKRSYFLVDRRSVFVEITEKGKQLLRKEKALRNSIIESYLSKLDKEEARLLTELLEKMIKADDIQSL
ncbi:MAG: transcriptional regulator [Bacillales bacterium]|nr:transcriptional regulator [Bacillales bacterium]